MLTGSRKILLIGGGGHCRSVADALIRSDQYDAIGIVDKHADDSEKMFGKIPVVGVDDDLPILKKDGWNFAFVTVGSVGNTDLRRKLFSGIASLGFRIPNIADPSAVVSENSTFGKGIFIGKNTIVNAGSVIGDAAILNTSSVIEHDCQIGAFVHVSPGAVLCGGVRVGDDAHIGARAVVKQYLTIGDKSIVGMGSVVIRDIGSDVTVVGCPAKPVV
ncbi:MAG: acetyltransferase [Lachnospiraceae bacterium]|jgi:sugar O-acyltransferase (sialic acid O-acetyltransferase NeuD family)|nr:acetyltransferase [Lachnospiraceae bacterium]MEE3460931.1 acetyltransferase [Lachnospiraceae bacterium]